ncbi:MAG: helix-turn-helix domain-containing protein [Lachnospiraceae bacterium]|nr:helix-turn-helix domain-containing protein [Lachnospiraceae bacterium]
MEFCEKLQELRQNKGLTQEELAEALYVSRAAVSKWESGRGYPSIDSLKEISGYFSVSIDDLLSGDQLITIAQRENKSNLRNLCDLLLGCVDLLSVMLIFLPLYPKPVDGYINSVNLLGYVDNSRVIINIYWVLFIAMIVVGMIKTLMVCLRTEKGRQTVTVLSLGFSVMTVLFLAMAKEPYAVTLVFLLLLIKGLLIYKRVRA